MRINAGDKNPSNAQDKAIADAYGNKFIIPLDFEMLDSAAPYYQAGLRNRLWYELTSNDYNQVTNARVSSPKVPDAKYKITDISLEYEIATQPDLVRSIRSESEGITLQIEKKEESAGALNAYIYLIMDAQLNIQNGAYISVVY